MVGCGGPEIKRKYNIDIKKFIWMVFIPSFLNNSWCRILVDVCSHDIKKSEDGLRERSFSCNTDVTLLPPVIKWFIIAY